MLDEATISLSYPKEIFSKDLHTLIAHFTPDTRILSLDCFDTLIWRKTTLPQGVFFEAQHSDAFKKAGLNPFNRMESEKTARIHQRFNHASSEITLHDIYHAFDSTLSETEKNALAAAELAAEIKTCYALPAALSLIKQALKQGIKIIIVSDTYFREQELRALLQHCLPEEIYHSLSAVFCSCDYQRGKRNGLFHQVLKTLHETPDALWHTGDNFAADVMGAQACGIRVTHLIAQSEAVLPTLLRLRTYGAGFIDSRIGYERPHYHPFAGVLSESSFPLSEPDYLVGYLSLGPILYAFAHYLTLEIAAITHHSATLKKPKLFFLMRDGYLPHLAFQTLTKTKEGHAIYISRFSAIAASFRTKTDVDAYLYKYMHPQSFPEITRQLLIPAEQAALIIQTASRAADPIQTFIDLIHRPEQLSEIYVHSKHYRDRLYTYLEKETGLSNDDTIIFIDLGYTGTAHTKLAPIFKEERNITVYSRYLIACYTKETDFSRRGLIDSTWCDDRAYSSLITFISLFEKLCAFPGNSVIDYDLDGKPIFSHRATTKEHHAKINHIQEKTLAFIEAVNDFCEKTTLHFDLPLLQDTVMSELCRLLFFPTSTEIAYLKTLEYELDMGSTQALSVFDEEKGLLGLKRRGLFFMEKNRSAMRTNFPAELRHASIELSTMLLMQERLKFDLRIPDVSLRRETIPIIFMEEGIGTPASLEAIPTYDGYYSLSIPMNYGEYQIGIQWGLCYEWLQIEAIEIIPARALYTAHESDFIKRLDTNLYFQELTQHSGNLYRCDTNTSLLVYLGDPNLQTEKSVLHIIFRPIERRKEGDNA